MRAIIISGLPAVGKTAVADEVAKLLKVKVLNAGDLLKSAAPYTSQNRSVAWWDTKDGIDFLKHRGINQAFDRKLDKKLMQIIKKGNLVVTSYTAPWLSDSGYKVWLSANMQTRAERMSKRDKISICESKRIIKERDIYNYKLYKKLYNIEFGKDKSPFNLVINTNKLSIKGVAGIIIKHVTGAD
jgi:cytidylate kinase